jgi:hypothetical protein
MPALNLRGRVAVALPLIAPRIAYAHTEAWVRDARSRSSYRTLSETEVMATRRSDTVFVFGSGSSIQDLSAEEWQHFADSDTLSFNWFPHQRSVRIDYHLIREVSTSDFDPATWCPALLEYSTLLRENPHYRETVFVVQRGWRALNGNRLVGLRLLPDGARLFRFTNRGRNTYEPPSESFSDGLSHSAMTLGDCINFAYLMGWRSIVLVGVDMYDHRYFWLGEDEEREGVDWMGRGVTLNDPFAAGDQIVSTIASWNEIFVDRDVRLSVYNPRSLLARVLPVYGRDAP